MAEGDDTITLGNLDARLRAVETMQEMILRLLATKKPMDGLLEHYGATDTQTRACYKLLDDLTARARGREMDRPSFGYFRVQLGTIFPALRDDREFVGLVIDTMKIERPAYRELHAYMVAHGWPTWDV